MKITPKEEKKICKNRSYSGARNNSCFCSLNSSKMTEFFCFFVGGYSDKESSPVVGKNQHAGA